MPTIRVLLFVALPCIAIAQQGGPAAAPVAVARVSAAEIKLGQRVVGTVRPLRQSTVGSAVDGRVLEFHVQRGQAVQRGDSLATLRTETLEIELAAAKAQLELFKSQLLELENGYLPETIAEAKANMLAAKAGFDNASRQLQRLQSLSASRAVSGADLEDALERSDSAKFRLQATQALLQRVERGPRPESKSQAEARIELQMQNVRLLEDRIEKCSIEAPYDGFVSEEFTQVGAWISRGDAIAQIVELREVEVEVATTAEHAVFISRGDAIRVEFPELPDQLLVGTVDRIVPVAESRARTFPLFVRLSNDLSTGKPLLMAGMLARVELPAGRSETMPLVPKDALVLNGNDRSVFVVDSTTEGATDQQGTARRVEVSLGVAAGGRIQVRGNVKKDDLVVVSGNERLVDGMTVRVVQILDDATPALETQTANETF